MTREVRTTALGVASALSCYRTLIRPDGSEATGKSASGVDIKNKSVIGVLPGPQHRRWDVVPLRPVPVVPMEKKPR